MDKYINYGIVGNDSVVATFSGSGELLRFFYPTVDYKQFVEWMRIGLKVNDSNLILLSQDENNSYRQKYIENTNILQTEIFNNYFKYRVIQTDYVPINESMLVRKFLFKNENDYDLNINMILDSNILTNINNDTCGYVKDNCLIQYNHDYTICLFSKNDLLDYQVNGVQDNIWTGNIHGKDYVGLSNNSAISYNIGVLAPGQEKEIVIFFMVHDNRVRNLLGELDLEIERVKNLDESKLYKDTVNYWQDYVKEHDGLKILKSKYSQRIKNIYIRTILLYPILMNEETGGISAGIEIDEGRTKCGRYSYCWPRDGIFISRAQDILLMKEETTKFYNIFCQKTQSKSGMWEQRFYTDGRLAPSWGYQIDETASVVIGLYDHYIRIKDIEFLNQNLNMLNAACSFLKNWTDDILSDNPKMPKSYDLWEEHEGTSLYSLGAVYAAFKAAFKIKLILNNNVADFEYDEYAQKIRKYALEFFYDRERKTLVRNLEDKKLDSSILGTITPFEMIDFNSEEVDKTIEKMENILRTYSGGFLRYEGDTYVGGNPWPIATLWMALVYLEREENEKALDCFKFVINSCSEHSYLGEQVDSEKMKPKWVIGLAWSHAMFIIVLEKLIEKGILNIED